MKNNFQNHFLIAMPEIKSLFFKRAVIYVFKHDKNGAMGIMINKIIKNITIKEILYQSNIQINCPNIFNKLTIPILVGGPILDNKSFILHSFEKKFDSNIFISKNLSITTSKDILQYIANLEKKPKNLLIALGYCLWVKNQLEKEILNNVWLTTKLNTDIIFKTPVSERWKQSALDIGIDIFRLTSIIGHS